MKNHTQKSSCAAACALLLGLLPVARAGTDGNAHFKMMDADGDGKVTRAEHAAAAQKLFAQCDANHDGVVTAAEMDAVAAKSGMANKDDMSSAEKIKVIDQDGDGKLTAAEHAKGSEDMFAKMDKNGDGVLSKAECDEAMKMMKKHT